MSKTIGFVIYDGPSLFDGKRIIVVANAFSRSKNKKTGKMVQTWVIPAACHPINAAQKGLDKSVCGSCKHRHFRSCYVNLMHGPVQVWKAWKVGRYPKVDYRKESTRALFAGRNVRVGSYGDPAAVPAEIWTSILSQAAGFTGYTHSWRQCKDYYKMFCMASCDTLDDVKEAKARGWRPFYVMPEVSIPPKGFFTCPASKEGGKKTTCAKCNGCRGGIFDAKKLCPTIVAHGVSWKMLYFAKGMRLIKNHKKYAGVAWGNNGRGWCQK